MHKSATIDANDHVGTDYSPSWRHFLGVSVKSCNLDWSHEEHVELNQVVEESLYKHSPLVSHEVAIVILAQVKDAQTQVVDHTHDSGRKDRSKHHSLLKDEVGYQNDQG